MNGGFAYRSPYDLRPGQPSPGLDYLPASPLLTRLPTTGSGRGRPPPDGPEGPGGGGQALSITGLGMGGSSPVAEYQLLVHRLRLSASP